VPAVCFAVVAAYAFFDLRASHPEPLPTAAQASEQVAS
jgi:hypothetical protein